MISTAYCGGRGSITASKHHSATHHQQTSSARKKKPPKVQRWRESASKSMSKSEENVGQKTHLTPDTPRARAAEEAQLVDCQPHNAVLP